MYTYTNVLLQITGFDWSLWRYHTVKLIYWWWGPKDLISVWILLKGILSNLSLLKQNYINCLYCEPFMMIVFFLLETFSSVSQPTWLFSNCSNCCDCDTVMTFFYLHLWHSFTCIVFPLLFFFPCTETEGLSFWYLWKILSIAITSWTPKSHHPGFVTQNLDKS